MLTINNNVYSIHIVHIIVVITVNYCTCILLYRPLNSYLYVHWILKINIIILIFNFVKLKYIVYYKYLDNL